MYSNPTDRSVKKRSAKLRTGVDGEAEIWVKGRKGSRKENGILNADIGPAESSDGGMIITA
jgi:hypothetical protein